MSRNDFSFDWSFSWPPLDQTAPKQELRLYEPECEVQDESLVSDIERVITSQRDQQAPAGGWRVSVVEAVDFRYSHGLPSAPHFYRSEFNGDPLLTMLDLGKIVLFEQTEGPMRFWLVPAVVKGFGTVDLYLYTDGPSRNVSLGSMCLATLNSILRGSEQAPFHVGA